MARRVVRPWQRYGPDYRQGRPNPMAQAVAERVAAHGRVRAAEARADAAEQKLAELQQAPAGAQGHQQEPAEE